MKRELIRENGKAFRKFSENPFKSEWKERRSPTFSLNTHNFGGETNAKRRLLRAARLPKADF